MNRKTNMPRYTLTLIDSTNQTPPIVLTAESTRTIIRQLTKRLDPTPERRRVQGSGGFTMERGRVKAFRSSRPTPRPGTAGAPPRSAPPGPRRSAGSTKR
ncbi:hypothetical protein [Bifidobacterium pseudocatenulatum]|uniref:hypothetical protein n=1 Tax=Bifidobacterium pseudocatenulatum TaxID=28026 RepID=UPI001F0D7076|nr:hypothetical protein [Bifidobacterium pseudocatenulatum]MCH4840862.1 hypothetical protein [Bifidobacterium pseudocatenulatum]